MMPAFSARDRVERVTELRLVIEVDRDDGRRDRRDDVRGVEAAAEADLEDGDATRRLAEQLEGDGRRALEEGRQVSEACRRRPALSAACWTRAAARSQRRRRPPRGRR